MYTFLKLSETTYLCCNNSSENSVPKGRTIRKVIGGGEAKIKLCRGNRKKKNHAPKKFGKKNCAETSQ
jgi:hypothetical protein